MASSATASTGATTSSTSTTARADPSPTPATVTRTAPASITPSARPTAIAAADATDSEGRQSDKKEVKIHEKRVQQYLPKRDSQDHSKLPALLQPFTKASYEREFNVKSNAIASREELKAIADTWAGRLNIPVENSALLAQELAIHCYFNGSSEQTNCDLHSTVIEGLNLQEAVSIIKEVTTLRQFAAYYATFVWNWGITTETPPPNWRAKGYTEETMYASFDTFNYVGSKLGMPIPPVRKPTKDEEVAARINGTEKIIQARGKNSITTSPMFSDGTSSQGRILHPKLPLE